ncbi:MAG: DNA double-strand break repair nuclease NurA, partial [Candidatus Heimdallarchaeaceae archaeon]
MSSIELAIDGITEKIKRYNEHRLLFQNLFKKVKYKLNPSKFPSAFEFKTTEESFVTKVPLSSTEGLKFAGIDGGVIHKSLNYFDIAMIRAVGVLFYHTKKDKPKVRYFPEENPFPDILTSIEPLSQNEVEILIALWRMQKEIRCGIELLEQDLPDIVILDGSVLPFVDIKQVQSNTFLLSQYKRVRALYRRLYMLCKKNRSLLCGVVKDSRSALLTKKLSLLLPHLSKMAEFKELLNIDYRPIVR